MTSSSQASAPPRPANRLIHATSPYLLQHAHNPVDWYPWGAEAIEKAQRENKPIFLSIGYSACHWCHVMEREVFENETLAQLLNEHFVSVKVDREERPDLDDLYMLATQLSTGSGGWPMSLWLTPDLQPFYAGTYIPPRDMMGRPGFDRVCNTLAEVWRTQPDTLRQQARQIVEAIRQYGDETAHPPVPDNAAIPWENWLTATLQDHADRFDPQHGGLGSAPKFPPSQALLLWLELLSPPAEGLQSSALSTVQLDHIRHMLTATLDAMMRGGIYDQIGGAFARYSTDEKWLVPHFEKMLYDNAQLVAVYARAAHLLHRPDYERIARQTLDYYLAHMLSKDGGFFSTLDADSEGREGKYYLWTIPQIQAALPNPDDANLIIQHFGLTSEGNFSEEGGPGANILYIARPVEQLAPPGTSPEALQKRIDHLCVQLRSVRTQRVPPALDDKILTAWNGLMISALAIAGRLFREPRYLEAAHRTMGYLLLHHMERGRYLLRFSRPAPPPSPPPDVPLRVSLAVGGHAFLEDHAALLNGLLDLIDSTTPTSLPGTMARKRAFELADNMIRLFHDPDQGGFFFTSPQHETLFARLKNAADTATPSANGLAIRALLRLAQISGKLEYREIAQDAVRAFAPAIDRQPAGFTTVLLGLVEDQAFLAAHNLMQPPAPLPVSAPLPVAMATPPEPSILTLDAVTLPPVRPGDSFEIPLTLHIAPRYHIQLRHPENSEAFATVVRLRGDVSLTGYDWQYPPGQTIAVGSTTLSGYAGTITFRGRATVQSGVAPGRYLLRATVLAQPCDATSCLPPERLTLEIPLVIE